MVSTFDIETGNFIYRDFDVNFAILHDKKMTNISLAGNKLSLVLTILPLMKMIIQLLIIMRSIKHLKNAPLNMSLWMPWVSAVLCLKQI